MAAPSASASSAGGGGDEDDDDVLSGWARLRSPVEEESEENWVVVDAVARPSEDIRASPGDAAATATDSSSSDGSQTSSLSVLFRRMRRLRIPSQPQSPSQQSQSLPTETETTTTTATVVVTARAWPQAEGFARREYRELFGAAEDALGPTWQGVAVPQTQAECRRLLKWVIRRGVPDGLRRQVWMATSGATELLERAPHIYRRARDNTFGPLGPPARLAAHPAFGGVLDAAEHYLTATGVEACKRLLCIVATEHPAVEYCPRIAGLAPLLLTFLSEADAFAVIEALFLSQHQHQQEQRHPTRFLETTRRENALFFRTFESIAADVAPRVSRRMAELGITAESFAQRWFDTLFVGSLPYPLVLRITDAFMCEGSKVLYRVGLGVITQIRRTLQAAPTVDGFLESLAQAMLQQSSDTLMKAAFRLSLSRKDCHRHNERNRHLVQHVVEVGTVYYRPKIAQPSAVFSEAELEVLWSFLPRRLAICDPVLIFAASRDGFNLATLEAASKAADAPCLLCIRALDCVLGVFSTGPLVASVRRDNPFGDGECFLFSLRPTQEKYAWTGAEGSVFFVHQGKTLLVGASGTGGVALAITEELRVQSQASATYGNPPLLGDAGTAREVDCSRCELYTFV